VPPLRGELCGDKPTIPIIVKDTTSPYWQIVLAALVSGKDLGVTVPELGAQSESDITGQISILENAVSEKPAAVVISPTEFKALGSRSTKGKKVRSSHRLCGDSKAFTSFLTTDNVQGGRIAADGLAQRHREIRQGGRRRRAHHLAAGRRLARSARKVQGRAAAKYPGLKLVADKVADGQATTG